MEIFEQSVLKDCPDKAPKLWLRYVDDTFVVIDKSEADPFFKFINNVDPNIIFAQEECCDNKLAFLACLVHRKSNGSLKVQPYTASPPIRTILTVQLPSPPYSQTWCHKNT